MAKRRWKQFFGTDVHDFSARQVMQLEWDKDGEILAILQQKEEMVMLWRHAEKKLDMLEMSSKDPTWLAWSKTGPQLVIGTAKGNLIIYNKRTMKKQTIMGNLAIHWQHVLNQTASIF